MATLTNRASIYVDRTTPFQEQLANLASQALIKKSYATATKYYSTRGRLHTYISLAELHCEDDLGNTRMVKARIEQEKENGVYRSADAYEFVAWLRHNSRAGLEYPLAALDQRWQTEAKFDYVGFAVMCSFGDPTPHRLHDHWVPHAYEAQGERMVDGFNELSDWRNTTRFLVVCGP